MTAATATGSLYVFLFVRTRLFAALFSLNTSSANEIQDVLDFHAAAEDVKG